MPNIMDTCQMPPELTEDELSALIDGEADERVRDHVLHCAYCAGRLVSAKQVESRLRMALYRRDCPTSIELAQYQMDMLDSSEDKARIEAHLKTCPHCRQDVQDWQRFIDEDDLTMTNQPESKSDKIISMPATPSERIVLFPEIVSEPKSAVRGDAQVKRIIATADTTTIRLAFESLPDAGLKLTIQLSSQEVDWREGMVTVQQDGQTIAVCQINTYQIATCELPQVTPISLRFVAADETLIEFNDVTP